MACASEKLKLPGLGPGPDRLGLGGQGSWAGPAWLGGPRVLGRAGLVVHYFYIMVLLYIIHSLF